MKKRVLICDNDPDIVELVSLILKRKGFDVFSSDNCNKVNQKIEQYHPDLIIMDLWIPDLGGEKATEMLKNSTDYKHIPVVILSANNEIANIAKRSGAEDYLAKPFHIESLVKKVNRYIAA
ncbi:response regulator [Fulvivirga sediminis]|uniref:Response regulator n=1 Tax=Fulvivirga sediminis TaxID=2803949 RepID=A0A937K2A1_9BACT|nr:response regulator [Fulvivirga sediminis]MBL3658361.1 response regulator [Fulvivirga sediminis]